MSRASSRRSLQAVRSPSRRHLRRHNPAIGSTRSMFRPLLVLGAMLAVGALPPIDASAADSPTAGVTALKDARAEGSFKLDLGTVDPKKLFFNPNYSADGFGLANVHVLLRKADQGAFNGQYGV